MKRLQNKKKSKNEEGIFFPAMHIYKAANALNITATSGPVLLLCIHVV